MEPIKTVTSKLVPLDRANVDTDAIIPKQFLKSIKRSGFGPNLFDEWRYLDQGEPGMDNSNRPINPDFVLNLPKYQNCQILLTQTNFGCGSSREHAPWALADYGFRVILAPSFADIFYNNCFKNGILPIVLEQATIDELFALENKQANGLELTVDLAQQRIDIAGSESLAFDIDPFRRDCLLNGWDDIALTLRDQDKIDAYEGTRKQQAPWLFLEH